MRRGRSRRRASRRHGARASPSTRRAAVLRETGFVPDVQFEDGLARTVQWYQENADWTARVRSGVYRDYYAQNYAWRTEEAEGRR